MITLLRIRSSLTWNIAQHFTFFYERVYMYGYVYGHVYVCAETGNWNQCEPLRYSIPILRYCVTYSVSVLLKGKQQYANVFFAIIVLRMESVMLCLDGNYMKWFYFEK